MVHETKLTSEIFCPTYTRLAQSVEHWSDDQETLGSMLIGENFLVEFILLFPINFWQMWFSYHEKPIKKLFLDVAIDTGYGRFY